MPSANEKEDQLELAYISGGNAKCSTTLENCLLLSYKVKHRFTT